MGGVQSGPHNLGDVNLGRDALWVQERLRHKNSRVPREGGSHHEHPGGPSSSSSGSRDQQKLLKRTKSLAVISEDNRAVGNRGLAANYQRLGEPTSSDACRRQQLIPRAKLINRHSLKDRLSKSQQHLSDSFEVSNPRISRSRFTSDTYSVSGPHVSLPNFVQHNSRHHHKPDQLNILEWPEAPKRYQSVRNLDNVSGLVDVVEENWPGEGNRSIDCIYTQIKRKRKEHRSLDSVLFEDDKELEYFNVLDLLPLSNVRLQFDDRTVYNNSSGGKRGRNFDSFERNYYQYKRASTVGEDCKGGDIGIGKKEDSYRRSDGLDPDIAEALNESTIKGVNDSTLKCSRSGLPKNRRPLDSSRSRKEKIYKSRADRDSRVRVNEDFYTEEKKKRVLILDSDEDKFRAAVAVVTPAEDYQPVEEAEDYKSIWISDSEETEEMSRRPQVLKVIDNDVTKRNRNSVIEALDVTEAINSTKETNKESSVESSDSGHDSKTMDEKQEVQVERVKNFFETKCKGTEGAPADQSAGKFERIIKETTSIFGKACNAVKGSLGFEARSESSDLGLGSESGSDTRRQSMDGVDGIEETPENNSTAPAGEDTENDHSGLSRSFSCADSGKNEIGPEFDHIRYKIMKSDLFSKNMFGSMKNDQAFDGLMQYLQEYSFHDLLVDNNVVIIEPVRAEAVERKCPAAARNNGKTKKPSSCRIAGAIQKKSQQTTEAERNSENLEPKSPKTQTSLRRHFFYHPIRVNRELIDDELPDPDTVRNVRKMFEGTLKLKTPDPSFSRNSPTRKTVSMKDLRQIDDFEASDKTDNSRSSSRAKDSTSPFENRNKSSDANKDGTESPRSESKTRIIAQAFEARSGQTSPSDSGLSKHRGNKYLHNWDAGSVSSGVSSDYPDTDHGSGVQCTSSEDEDEGQDDEDIDNGPVHSVSQDVLKKIRECGTSVTYYGGKVVNTCNSPLISPPITGKIMREIMKNKPKSQEAVKDYVKFRLVKSNSCDSRLELAGRVVNGCNKRDKILRKTSESNMRSEYPAKSDLRKSPIMESLNVEIVANEEIVEPEIKKEPPIVIGLEPKKEEIKEPEMFKADFKLGKLEDSKCYANKFSNSSFKQWQVNDKIEEKKCNFGDIDFEEFEVLEDSLNTNVKKN